MIAPVNKSVNQIREQLSTCAKAVREFFESTRHHVLLPAAMGNELTSGCLIVISIFAAVWSMNIRFL